MTEWDCAPASDQLAYTYCVPVGPACGDVTTAMVWLVPGVQETLQGAVQLLPSTDSDKPLGELVTVIVTAVPLKFAMTLAGPFMVKFCGVVVPLSAPLKPVN